MWTDVVRRFASHGLPARAVELWEPVPTDATLAALAGALGRAISAIDGDVIVVAHGTAVPVARAAVARTPVDGLVLTNGPLEALDPATRTLAGLARSPRALAATLLQPAAWNRWLASSAGMRRTVVNPYVMDRDTVVALTAPYTRTAEHRAAAARFLRSLRTIPQPGVPLAARTLLVWGTEDPLYPTSVVDSARRLIPGIEVTEVPGGQHFHPVERPWYLADLVAEWLSGERSTGAASR